MLHGYIRTMVPGNASRQILLYWRNMTLINLVNLEGVIKMMNFLKFNQMFNKLLLKKSLLFVLHYVNFKRFIMTHQQPPLRLEACDTEGSYLKQT